MTDNEIIKALACCYNGNQCAKSCPYNDGDDDCVECTSALARDTLDLINRYRNLINRQKAEIERLKDYNENLLEANVGLSCGLLDEIKRARAEAIKEFAERLRKRLERKYTVYGREYVLRHMRDLVKEMTEEQK